MDGAAYCLDISYRGQCYIFTRVVPVVLPEGISPVGSERARPSTPVLDGAIILSIVVAAVLAVSALAGSSAWLTGLAPVTGVPTTAVSTTGGIGPLVPIVGSVGSLPIKAIPSGKVAGSTTVHFDLDLAIPQTSSLSAFLQGVNTPGSPDYQHYLSLSQFYQRFGPSSATVTNLVNYLSGNGLTVSPTSGPLVYRVSGPANAIDQAFHIELYQFSLGSQSGIAPRGVPELPSSIASAVESFTGLNGFDVPHVMLSFPSISIHPLAATTPSVMQGFYNDTPLLNAGDTGSGTIGLAEVCDPGETDQGYQNDLNQFDTQYGLPSTTLQFTGSGSSTCSGGQSGWDTETDLDIQWAHVIAPGATILVCLDSSDPSVCDQTFVSQGIPFGSNSWGGGGPYHSIWQSAEAAGITLLASAGDNGAAVDYPAAEPDGLGVGGTTITPSGSSYGSESAWSGTGGGCDVNDSPPSYQVNMPGLSSTCGGTTERGVPDVAMDADPNSGVNVITNGQSQQVGGTSLACPMWAAALNVIYQAAGATGFAGPRVYSLAEGSLYHSVFHDVTTGSNGYSAGPGWDAATGVGTPNIGALAAHWNAGSGGGGTPLSASASGSPTSGTAPVTVSFTGSASGGTSPYSYAWSFGDGGTSASQNPSHTYSSAGSYTATLTVTDASGATATSSVAIAVSAAVAPLTATAGASPTQGTAPLAVTYTGTATGGTAPYTYSWTFGDGGTSSAQNPSHTYSTAGTFTSVLSVTDAAGTTASSSVQITVSSPPSSGGCTSATSVSIGTQVSGSVTGGGCMLLSAVVSQTNWNNYYYLNAYETDGTVSGNQPVFTVYTGISPPTVTPTNAAQSQAGPNAAMTISLSVQSSGQFGGWGTYEFLIQASSGSSGSFCFELQFSNSQAGASPACNSGGGPSPLTASASATPTSGTAPLTVTFTGSATGGSSPYSFSWSFGDGASGTGSNPSHTYSASGTYTSTLTVKDSSGASATNSVTITVSPASGGGGCTIGTAIAFGQQVSGSLASGGCMLLSVALSQSQWNNYYYINAYESDGAVTGPQPAFTVYTGVAPPTVSVSNAAQSQAGPNAIMQIDLYTQASGQFGGWGTYEFLIQASTGSSGGFCFEVQLSNSATGNAPACSATLPAAAPSSTGVSSSPTQSAPTWLAGFGSLFGGLVAPIGRNPGGERTSRKP